MRTKRPSLSNDFMREHVTDGLYNKIIKELRTNPEGEQKKDRGRKRELTREILRNYLLILSMTGEYEFSANSAGLPEKRRQKYMVESETFRGVSELAKYNLSMTARTVLYKAIEGRKPGYYEMIHPVTKKRTYIFLGQIIPNVKAAMWYLDQIDYFGYKRTKHKHSRNKQLGEPQNEREVKLTEELLKRHRDYVRNREQENN